MLPWYEDDSFWAEMQAAIFTPERVKQAAQDVEQIIALLGLQAGQSLLDLGCGIGRHAIEFARRGLRVTGVDRCAAYLQTARERATAEGVDVEWVHEDMRRFRRPGAFDVAVNLLTSFGYFEDPADDRLTLDNFFANTKPGGTVLMDLMSKEVLARIYRERDWHEWPDGTLLLESRTVADHWQWLDVRWLVIRQNERRERRFRLRLFAATDLIVMFRAAGFESIECQGSLTPSKYDHEAQRLVVMGRKPVSAPS